MRSTGSASPRTVSVFGAVGLTLLWLLLAGALMDFDALLASLSSARKLDLRLYYGHSDVRALFDSYGGPGRRSYEAQVWLDQLFALVVGAWASRLALAHERAWQRQLFAWAPWSFCALDLLENSLLLTLLGTYPALSSPLVRCASVCTVLKLGALGFTYTSAAVFCVRALAAGWQGRALHHAPWRTLSRRETVCLLGLSFVSGLLLTGIQSHIWHRGDVPAWLQRALPEALGATQARNYERFGRIFVIIPLCLTVVLRPLAGSADALALWRWRLLVVATAADIGSYWIAGWEGRALRAFTFWGLEVPAWLGVGVLYFAAGIRQRCGGELEARRATANLAVLPLMVISAAIFQYLPHALALPVLWVAGLQRMLHEPRRAPGALPSRG